MMHRGDIIIIAQRCLRGQAASGRRHQIEDLLADDPSILVCLLTGAGEAATGAFYRIPVDPSAANGLVAVSIICADKIATVRKTNIGQVIGRLDEATLGRLNTALALF